MNGVFYIELICILLRIFTHKCSLILLRFSFSAPGPASLPYLNIPHYFNEIKSRRRSAPFTFRISNERTNVQAHFVFNKLFIQ